MKRKNLFLWSILLATFYLASCTVDQTKETKLPDVDVDVKAGQMPAFDVDWADVDVGTRTETVTVPTVKVVMEELEVEMGGLKEELTHSKENRRKDNVRFELQKQDIKKTAHKNMENQRNMLELEHKEKMAEMKIKMNKTFDFNRNYLINKYTKEMDEIKNTKGRHHKKGKSSVFRRKTET